MSDISKTYKFEVSVSRSMKKHYKATADGRPLYVECWSFYATPSFDQGERFMPPAAMAEMAVGRGDSPLACVTDLLGKMTFFDKTLLELDEDTVLA